jgi:hypothetical protein
MSVRNAPLTMIQSNHITSKAFIGSIGFIAKMGDGRHGKTLWRIVPMKLSSFGSMHLKKEESKFERE